MNAIHGPWEALDSMTVRGPFRMGDPDAPGLLICDVSPHYGRDERMAIARLIAVAPELMAASAAAEDALRYLGGTLHADRLRAVMDKAK